MSVPARSTGGARYGVVARVLHWSMVVAIGTQFVVGYAMDRFEVLDWVVDRWLGGEDDRLIVVHAGRAPLEWADDDVLLGAHITTHVAFFAGFATHVGLVLKHQLVDRDRLLRRML